MDLPAIEMPEAEARKHYLDYRKAVREGGITEDALIMRGYRELAKGKKLIRLSEAIVAGGFETQHWTFRPQFSTPTTVSRSLPRLAVAKADRELVYCPGVTNNGTVDLIWHDDPASMSSRNRRDHVIVSGFRPGTERQVTDHGWRRDPLPQAMVPIVPPALRPGDRLGLYHVLFEAEWELHAPPAPVDPALIRHIGGDLYAVVATWELTEIERAVLALTR